MCRTNLPRSDNDIPLRHEYSVHVPVIRPYAADVAAEKQLMTMI